MPDMAGQFKHLHANIGADYTSHRYKSSRNSIPHTHQDL